MPEPETESFVQTVPDYCERIVWKGTYIHLPIANAAPCARCTELEEQIRKSALDSLSAERQSDEEIEELQAKITEQAAKISELEKELNNRIAGSKVSVPTDSMEQEFSSYHRRGYEAGKRDTEQKQAAEIERLRTEVSNLTSQFI